MKFRNIAVRFGSPVLLLASASAFAQTGGAVAFDPAPVLAIVDSAQDFIIAVGLAVLTMLMVAKGIKWARRAG